jgi:hypothetical protein
MFVSCVLSEVPASGWSLVQRSPAEHVVSACDREAPYGEAIARNQVEEPQKKSDHGLPGHYFDKLHL